MIPVVAAVTSKLNGMAEPARPANGQWPPARQLHRQVWNGRGWVLDDDDRVFHPAHTDRPTAAPADAK